MSVRDRQSTMKKSLEFFNLTQKKLKYVPVSLFSYFFLCKGCDCEIILFIILETIVSIIFEICLH